MRTALLALLLGLCGTARAGEDEWTLGVAPVLSNVNFDSRQPWGGGASAFVTYGLSDSWSLHAATVFTAHPVDPGKNDKPPGGTIAVAGGYGGVRYAFDLLRTVPYLDLGLGILWANGGGTSGQAFSYQAAIGFDRLQSPTWSWGAVVAYQAFVSDYSRLPVYLYMGPTFTWRWY